MWRLINCIKKISTFAPFGRQRAVAAALTKIAKDQTLPLKAAVGV